MRLTKYEPQENSMFPYQLKDDELRTKLDAIHKLGQLENIEEEFEIDDIEDLRDRLTKYKFLANHKMSCVDVDAYNLMLEDLDKYHSIEKELGIDLMILFKALKDGIWIQEVHDKKKTIHVKVTLYYLEGFAIPYKNRYDKEGNYFGSVRYFSDYKRTWALAKEELE